MPQRPHIPTSDVSTATTAAIFGGGGGNGGSKHNANDASSASAAASEGVSSSHVPSSSSSPFGGGRTSRSSSFGNAYEHLEHYPLDSSYGSGRSSSDSIQAPPFSPEIVSSPNAIDSRYFNSYFDYIF